MTDCDATAFVQPGPSHSAARRSFHVQAGWSAAFAALLGPLVLTSMALRLDAPDALLGYAGVLPSLAGALTLLTAPVAGRVSPRTATIALVVLSRLLAAGLVVLPALGGSPGAVVVLFALALGSLTLHAQATSTLHAWLLDYVPAGQRGGYTSRRLTVSLIVTSALSLLAGWLLDRVGASGLGPSVLVLLAAASAAPEIAILRTIAAPRDTGGRSPRRWRLGAVARDRRFRSLSCGVAAFLLALHLSDSYTYAHLVGNLRLSTASVALVGLLGTLPQLALLPWWGRRCDRRGHGRVLRASMWLFALETLVWSLAGSGAAVGWVPVGFLVSAVANSAFTVAVFARRYELTPRADRLSYEAAFTAVTAASYLVAPALGALARQALAQLSLPFAFGPARIGYACSALAIVLLQLVTRPRRDRR